VMEIWRVTHRPLPAAAGENSGIEEAAEEAAESAAEPIV